MTRLSAESVRTRPGRTRRMVAAVLGIVVASLLTTSPPSAAQAATDPADPVVAPIGAPGSTALITHIATKTVDGWRYDQYRNPAYPCSFTGDNTFTIATKLGTPDDAVRPLWVYLHGGGFGYFDQTGTPRPDTWHMREEPITRQISFLDNGDSNGGGGLLDRARSAPAGFRMLAVSMCDYDGYGGPDIPDPNNRYLTPDDEPRTVNGLYATKAAVAFALRTVPTDDIVLHGTSAGSFGAWHVAWALDEQGLAPTAVVADSGVISGARAGWSDEDPGCGGVGGGTEIFRSRLHPAIVDPANEPADLVADGRLSSPVLDLWVGNDPIWCGDTPVRCPIDDGPDINLGANDCRHEGLRRAIAAQGPTSRSRSMEVCVDDPALAEDCDRHVPTVFNTPVNTAAPWPADYLTSIMDWVGERLGDDPASSPRLSLATALVVDLLGGGDRPRAEAIAHALAAGSPLRAELIELTHSEPWLEAIVQHLYRTTLGRDGDPASVAYWIDELATERRTVAQVSASFYASPEYYGRAGGTPRAWIGDVYAAILHRPASGSDITFWTDQVRRRGRSNVAHTIFQSPESGDDRVTALYQRLLGRAPSATDRGFWSPRVRSRGDLALAVSLAESAEYATRAQQRYP